MVKNMQRRLKEMFLTSRRPCQGLGHLHHVGDDGLNAVPLSLHLGHEPGHLVAVVQVLHVAVHVQSHLGAFCFFFF